MPAYILKLCFSFLLFANIQSVVFAQTIRPKPDKNTISTAPWWAQEMYSDQPNVYAVDSAYTIWRKAHPTTLNYHTKFYKHWRRAIGSHIDPRGFWEPVAPEKEVENLQHWQTFKQGGGFCSSWESIGPFETLAEGESTPVSWQANVYCLDQSASNPQVVYCGTEGGSIFKSTDKGENWSCTTDNLNLRAIGAVKVDPTNPQIAYFGEGNNLYKTTDGGTSWILILTDSGLKARDISINPSNNQIVLVAGEGGLHRSTDGGSSWTQLYTEGCWDMEIKTDDNNTVFLLKTNTTTNLCEFFKSTDMGATWTKKGSGWIDPAANSTADNEDNGARLGVSDADPNRIYALLIGAYNEGVNDNNYLGVYKSDDAGETWSLPNANASGGPGGPYAGDHTCLVTFWFNDAQRYPNSGSEYNQGFYNLGLDVSDTNADHFLVGFLNLFKSEDGGTTFTRWGGYGGGPGWQHPDIQDIDVNGSDVWVSSDGGINLYAPDFSSHAARNRGIAASDYWGFDSGWNEDVLTGGRYHNGNSATILGTYPSGQYIRLGGGEATTGFVHPAGGRKVMHSDISPKILPTTVTGSTSGFTFSAYPNEGYAGNNENSSEIEPDPRCYNHLFMGSENNLLKSGDGGVSWTTLFTFGGDPARIITGIEISRSNPDVIYCVQNNSPAALFKSTDGGQSFVQTNSPPGAVNGGAFITLSPLDENKIWLAWSVGGNNSNKVFESTNGGSSWTNLSSSALNGHFNEQLLHIGGTDDGLYLATDFGVFYRSDSEGNWIACADGLPAKAKINRLLPFYANGKVRIATYHRGIWQSDFAEAPTQPIVQPTVDKLAGNCSRDTFFFDDYSMVDHNTASWSWSFDPAPQYVSSHTTRNPAVVFGAAGTYTATLTLNGAFSKSLEISITNGCEATTVPGNALSLDPSGYSFSSSHPALNSNTVTITCWVKAADIQNGRAALVFFRGGTTVTGIGFSTGRKLSYHWDGSQWWWDPNLTVPADTWTHVALVVTPSAATIYLNGVGATNTVTHNAEAFDTPLILGYDSNSTARRFTGQLDEVTIWDRALSQNEIRELMHLTLVPADHPNLKCYYQVNESSGQILDRAGSRHLSLVGTAARNTSTVPVGGGVSARMTVSSGGNVTFGTTGLSMQFPAAGTYPNGELCVSRLNLDPDQLPNANPHSTAYWIVNNYGSNTTFSALDNIQFEDYGNIAGGTSASAFKLYKRSSFADGNTWGSFIDSGDEVVTGASGGVTFSAGNGVDAFSQFVIVQEAVLPVEWLSFYASLQYDKSVRLHWSVEQSGEESHFEIERSRDGKEFQGLSRVNARAGAGNFQYEFPDKTPEKGVNYYRLRQIDQDGKYTYSPIRQVTLDALSRKWTLFPNPVEAGAPLHIRTHYPGEYRLLVYNSKGGIAYAKTLEGDALLTDIDLPPGVYAWQIVFEEGKERGKLVVGGQ